MIKKLTTWLGWIALAFVIIILAFVVVTSRKGWQFAAVLSGSMKPGFQVGGLVVIKPVDVNTLQVGDVISFMSSNLNTDTPVCHRIIAIQYQKGVEYFQTKGDANKSADQGFTPVTNVKGKEIFYVPYIGRLADIKKVGTTPVNLMITSLPWAVVIVAAMGLLFIVLVSKDTLESIFFPGRQWQREAVKKRNERYALRRRAFKL
jgi:signal peptidase I